ncbi:hypothetical protein H7H78_17450 [Mycobacterium shinjukuense]|uniref:phosphopantetheine-binding protein n=1 Tax=Mycobacterium shinjukuense TaxID=398694 RepID=UPI000A0A878E|nr:phosphopantetheine-binding protein [Mycobacterium shinjukuense]MCV6987132.1 hypothetical protein [Mycobacterium shinjukuense]ORB61450.1 hypothetical protein BST45_19960 [Mycobacterium shinjukuense]
MADRMAEVLGAEVVEPESVDLETLRDYDLVGFGSGMYFTSVDARSRRLLRRLPVVDGVPAFTFFTSDAPQIPLAGYTMPIRKLLASKGFRVLGSFSCRRWDTVGPFGLVGGINKGRPDEHDLHRAAAFVGRLCARVVLSQTASGPMATDERTVLAMVRGLVAEVSPRARPFAVRLDTTFEDLGIGSLEVAELLLRVQDKVGVALPPGCGRFTSARL